MAVSDDAIQKNTSTTLGIDQGAFKITDRVDDGIKTSYLVTTDAGKKYSCYVTGTVTVTGRVVSDAVCSQMVKASVKTSIKGTQPSGGSCNALLQAAGKC